MSTTGIEFVTGGLGDGKSLYCVARILRALAAGRKVATNYNLNLEAVCRPDNNWARVIRVPDAPTVDDLRGIGLGSDDPKKKGLLVLDELGTWFNARDFAAKGRAEVIKYCIHLRKKRWDVLFIVQDFSMVDRQIRGGMTTFLTSCRSSHKGWWGFRVLPEFFWASVRNKERIHVRTDFVFPGEQRKLWPFYDTEQLFDVKLDSEDEQFADPVLLAREKHYAENNGFYCFLPPAYTLCKDQPRPRRKWDFRLSQLVFPAIFFCALLGGGYGFAKLTGRITKPFDAVASTREDLAVVDPVSSDPKRDFYARPRSGSSNEPVDAAVDPVDVFQANYGQLTIVGYSRFGDVKRYQFRLPDGSKVSQEFVESAGIAVRPRGRNEALLVSPEYRFVTVQGNL